MKTEKIELATLHQIIWQQCWDPKACVHNPFGNDWCLGFHACVRVVDDGGTYFLELEVNGNVARVQLANACYPVYSIGIATLEVCVDGLQVVGNQLKSIHLIVKACVGGDVGPVHIGQCWTLYDGVIQFLELRGEAQKMSGVKYVHLQSLLENVNEFGHVHKRA
jgi:hypothetical protein